MEITVAFRTGIAEVTLDDGKKNVITVDAARRLDAVLAEAEGAADAIVLSGRPGSFCAGFDRAIMVGDDDAARSALGAAGARVAQRLFDCPKPVVAACTGHAFTIGALWLMACDTRIGERGAYKFAMTETVMGATLSGWPLALLETRVPPRLMTPIAVQSLVLDPEDAVEAGYLDRVVDAGEAVAAARQTANALAQLPLETYAANKRAVRSAVSERIRASLAG
ncbi:MAG: crotonase/enoyl-CoA hydratase family protein [Pseudomonadota bacterium]